MLGIEQFDIPHDKGSSHGQSRMTRMAYYEHPDYVPLLLRAYELWRELEQEAGADRRPHSHSPRGHCLRPLSMPSGQWLAKPRG